MNETVEIRISVGCLQKDILSGVLYSEGCLGIHEIDEKMWRVYFDKSWASNRTKNLFLKLKALNPEFDDKGLIISKVPFQDWNREWKKYFKPIESVEGIWIRPPWEELPAAARGIEIIIDPQMAFGTGHHESTGMMIRLMSEISFNGKNALDVGTGSGILAILASKLGAKSVAAIDNDSDAIANAKHNFQLNQTRNIELKYCSVHSFEGSKFEVVLANIDLESMSSFLSKFKGLMDNKGKLIISGILTDEASQIESLYANGGLTLLKQKSINEWAAMMWEKCS